MSGVLLQVRLFQVVFENSESVVIVFPVWSVRLYLFLLYAVIRVRLQLRQLDQGLTTKPLAVIGSTCRVNHTYLIVLP